jgi:hypothetical protein
VFAAPALGRRIMGRVRPLISLAYPAPNQVPRLVRAAPPQLVHSLGTVFTRAQQLQLVEAWRGAKLIRVSKKSATDRHGLLPEHLARRPTSTPQHPLILVITLYARSGRRGRGFESRHPDSKTPGQRRFMSEP